MNVDITMIEFRTSDGTHYRYKDNYKWERKLMWHNEWENVSVEAVPYEVKNTIKIIWG